MGARRVGRVVRGMQTSDGAGVRLKRSIGTPTLDHVDPFLLLDEFRSDSPDDYIAGFPDHPHRGFETVTYMLAGAMEHRDHAGNRGLLEAGSVQWMTAGRGIIHSEMPRQHAGLMWGFQLWVNLPAAHKLDPPRYQDIPPGRVPERTLDSGARLRVIAGRHGEVAGPVEGIVTAPLYLDVALPAGVRLDVDVPAGHTACAYVFEGGVGLGAGAAPPVPAGQLAVLEDGDVVSATGGADGGRFLLLAARPLGEPVVRHGPFVMNTRAEILQALADLRNGTFLG